MEPRTKTIQTRVGGHLIILERPCVPSVPGIVPLSLRDQTTELQVSGPGAKISACAVRPRGGASDSPDFGDSVGFTSIAFCCDSAMYQAAPDIVRGNGVPSWLISLITAPRT